MYITIQSIAYKELFFEIGLRLQIKKFHKIKTKTFCASKKENEEMRKTKRNNIHGDVFAARDHLDGKIA